MVDSSTHKTPRRLCPECRYPLLRLDGFDGISSADAPGFDRLSDTGGMAFVWWDWMIKPFVAFLFARKRQMQRQEKVRALKAEVLSEFPKSTICPQCLYVDRRA